MWTKSHQSPAEVGKSSSARRGRHRASRAPSGRGGWLRGPSRRGAGWVARLRLRLRAAGRGSSRVVGGAQCYRRRRQRQRVRRRLGRRGRTEVGGCA